MSDLAWLEERVAGTLEEAGATLLSMPTAGAVPPSLRVTMPRGVMSSAISAHGEVLPVDRLVVSERDVADMAVAYAWIAPVPDVRWRRTLWLRSFVHPRTGFPFWGARRQAQVLDVHSSTIEAWHAKGVRSIAATLHRLAVPAAADRAA